MFTWISFRSLQLSASLLGRGVLARGKFDLCPGFLSFADECK
jgi:hypothetical protein